MIRIKLPVLVLIGMMLCVPTRAKSQLSRSNKGLQEYLESLKLGTLYEKRLAVLTLYRLGKQAIRALVEHLKDSDPVPSSTLMLHSPAISFVLPGADHDELEGVLYAYVIELIVANDNLATNERDDPHALLGVRDYVYGQGVIVKGEYSPTDLSRITLANPSDLPEIQRIYSGWWRRNKNKPLAEMRREWKANRRPLTGSQYHWE
jgi:hypothetical protein